MKKKSFSYTSTTSLLKISTRLSGNNKSSRRKETETAHKIINFKRENEGEIKMTGLMCQTILNDLFLQDEAANNLSLLH